MTLRCSVASAAVLLLTVTLAATEASAQVCRPAPAGATAWYPGDRTTDDVVTGQAGVAAAPSAFGPGKVGDAFAFTGTPPTPGLFVNAPAALSDFTIEFWLRTTSARDETILSTRAACGPLGVARLSTAGTRADAWWEVRTAARAVAVDLIRVEQTCTPVPGVGPLGGLDCSALRRRTSLLSAHTINDGQYHHLAISRVHAYSSIALDGVVDAFTDGSVVETVDPSSGTASGAQRTADRIEMTGAINGIVHAGGAFPCETPFSGSLDELTFYGRALDPSEIGEIVAAGGNGKCKSLAFGYNWDLQLGIGRWSINQFPPVSMPGLPPLTKIAMSGNFGLALARDGRVFAWGVNGSGQLGDGTTNPSYTPKAVPGLSNVTSIAVGDTFSVAAKADGTVWVWGWNNNGFGVPAGGQSLVPVAVPGATNITAVAASSGTIYALRCDGTVLGWGGNAAGQRGDPGRTEDTPLEIPGLTDITAIAGIANTTAALRRDGTVWTLGSTANGELGDGSWAVHGGGSKTPVRVSGLDHVTAISGAPHGFFFLALRDDGTVWGWGSNAYGQTGALSITDVQTVPVQVMLAGTEAAPLPLTGISAIAAGDLHGLAVARNGTVFGWGYGSNRAIGYLPDLPGYRYGAAPIIAGVNAVAAAGLSSFAYTAYPSAVARTFTCAECIAAPATGLLGWFARGEGVRFDGSSFVELPNNLFPYPHVDPDVKPFGFDTWFSTTSGGVILGQQDAAANQPVGFAWPAIYVGTDGRLHVHMFYNGSGSNQIVSPLPVNDGRLHHVAVSYDGAVETVFLDGVRLPSITTTQLGLGVPVFHYQLGTGYTYYWTWGGTGSDGWFPFTGLLREVHVYDHALALADVLSVYFAGGAGFCPALTTPTITWPTPADITAGTPLSSTQLNAVASADHASVFGTFAYDPPAGTVLLLGAHTLSVTFTPDDTGRYAQATASVSITVTPPPPLAEPSPISIAIVEHVEVADATDVIPAAMLALVERIVVADGVALRPSALIMVAEQVHVGDGATLLPAIILGITETVRVSDAPGVLPVDSDPPVITFPPVVVADATTPSGAIVAYVVTAIDAVDGAVAVSCTPTSQSTFPIGNTRVICTAGDRAGNSSTVAFTVNVLSPAQQFERLVARASQFGFKQGAATLSAALEAVTRGTGNACGSLGGFANQVKAQRGKSLSEAQALELLNAAATLAALFGC